jgi:hypothetical protein
MNAIYPSLERSWQHPARREGTSMRLVDSGVTVKDRILLHLLDYWGQLQRAEWPVALTQNGIAGVVGISRSHVAVSLPDLIEDEMVEASTQRVEGRPRRVKVYSLTYKGGSYAGGRAQHLLRTNVTAVDDSGEWEIPLDGLIQVHKVHMLSALRLVDEENRVDLRKVSELTTPSEDAEEAEEPEAEQEPEAPKIAATEVGTPPTVVEPSPGPMEAVAPGEPVDQAKDETLQDWALKQIEMESPRKDVQGGPPAMTMQPRQQWPGYGQYPPQQAYFWSPLRFGTGRRPSVASVSAMLVLGFLCLMSAVALFGLSPLYCAVGWVPLVLIGWLFAWSGFKSTWALGPLREVWTATALAAYMLIGITMLTFAAFGQEALVDLLWAGLILGVPSLALAAGTGRSVERRGSFMLLIGPVMMIAALTMAVLDPEGMGRTGAMPILIVTVGISWAFVGWTMVREIEAVEGTHLVVAGGSIGLAIAAVAGAGNLATEGELGPVLAVAIATWVVGAAYVASISLLPSMAHLRPDAKTVYSTLAVSGAAALLTASAFFVWGGLLSVGVLEAVIAVGMLALVAPDMKDTGTRGLVLTVLGVVMAAISVLAVSVGL